MPSILHSSIANNEKLHWAPHCRRIFSQFSGEVGKWVKRNFQSTRQASVHNRVLKRVMYQLLIGAINSWVTTSLFNVNWKCLVSRDFPKIVLCFLRLGRSVERTHRDERREFAYLKSSHHPPTPRTQRKAIGDVGKPSKICEHMESVAYLMKLSINIDKRQIH